MEVKVGIGVDRRIAGSATSAGLGATARAGASAQPRSSRSRRRRRTGGRRSAGAGSTRASRRRRGRPPSGRPSPGRPSSPASGRRGWSTRPCSSRLRSRSGTRRTAGTGAAGRSPSRGPAPTAAGTPNRSPRRYVASSGLVELARARRRRSAQADRRLEPGLPPLHRLVEVGLDQVRQERANRPLRAPRPGPPWRASPPSTPATPSLTLPMAPDLACEGPGAMRRSRRRSPAHRSRLEPRLRAEHERRESNPQPPVLETGALPIELRS